MARRAGGEARHSKEGHDIVAESILRRIASGEQSAVQDCIDQYGRLVWSLSRRLAPSLPDAEDAVQEIFIDLWKNAERFDASRSSESAFVAMIARRRLIDRLRRQQRQPAVESLSEEGAVATVAARVVTPDTCAEAALAAEAIEALRGDQRRVLQLAIYQGLTHSEIARETGVPLGTVKTHVRRGLQAIRKVLGVDRVATAEESPQ